MAVFRLERTRDYTVMSNHHLRDKRLSLKASRLFSFRLTIDLTYNIMLIASAQRQKRKKAAAGQSFFMPK